MKSPRQISTRATAIGQIVRMGDTEPGEPRFAEAVDADGARFLIYECDLPPGVFGGNLLFRRVEISYMPRGDCVLRATKVRFIGGR